jgi:DNA gyrase subunit A
MLTLQPEEKITNVIPVRDFSQGALLMATQRGLVKKTTLEAYSRPQRGGIIAIKLEDGDNLIGVVVTNAADHVVLSTKKGKAIRFDESDARPMGRATYGVKGITLGAADEVVGIVVADPTATLLTVCERGFGKRTPFGTSTAAEAEEPEADESDQPTPAEPVAEQPVEPSADASAEGAEGAEPSGERGNVRYRTQRRGGKGQIDIKTTARNGDVVAIASVRDQDEVMIITARGMMVRTRVSEISVIGRNTQGVRLIRLDEGDTVASLAKIAAEEQ